jgi:hypothetical protein
MDVQTLARRRIVSTGCCFLAVWTVIGLVGSARAATPGPQHHLKVIVYSGYLPQVPVLVRVELRKANGERDREVWNADAVLSETVSGVTLSTNRITLANGLGTAQVTVSGSGDFNLQVSVGTVQTSVLVRDLSAEPVTRVGGTLTGTATSWSGVVNVTNDVTVPSGHTLTIQSNTLVLVNGVASGTTAPDLFVNGSIQSLGTAEHPITITCANGGQRWGQIRHTSAQPSLYRYTAITRAGRAQGEGHTGQAPAVRPTNSRIVFESCTISDHAERASGTPGKIMQASGSDLVFNDCVLARARMGPEIMGTGVLFTNSYILEMYGPDDADGIYIHSAGNQPATLVNSVIGFGNDDGIDTLGADVMVDDCIIRDWLHPTDDTKGISVFNRTVRVRRSLVIDCVVGISAKWNAGAPATVFIQESTVIATSNSIAANVKGNAPGPFVDFRITNSIITGLDPLKSDFGTTNFTIGYSLLGEAWAGTNNVVADPLFVSATNHDFRLRRGSPAIDGGNPLSPPDPDGSRIDIGYFTFEAPPPVLSAAQRLPGGGLQFELSAYTNRNYAIEVSTNLSTWGTLTTVHLTNEPRIVTDSATDQMRLYRARLTP